MGCVRGRSNLAQGGGEVVPSVVLRVFIMAFWGGGGL